MTAVDSHDATADDDGADADAESTVPLIEGHAVQFNEYRY